MAWIDKRKTKDGKMRVRAVVRMKGFPVASGTFPNETKAKDWARRTEAAMEEGRYLQMSEAKRHTIKELIERYERDHLPRKIKSKQGFQIRWWKVQLGHFLLADLMPSLVAEYRDKLKNTPTPLGKERSPASIVRYLAALSHICSVAVKEYGWMNDNPVLHITKPSEPRGRIRYLDEDERRRLLESTQKSENPFLHTIVVLALSTGMRQAEMMNLKWNDVDLDKDKIVLHETKNGERRIVALKGLARELLKKLHIERKIVSHLLFPGNNPATPINIRSAWEYALKRADIHDFRFHDLRHTFASYLAMNGASMPEIAAALGHKTLSMVKRYAHIGEVHTASVVEKMNQKIFGT